MLAIPNLSESLPQSGSQNLKISKQCHDNKEPNGQSTGDEHGRRQAEAEPGAQRGRRSRAGRPAGQAAVAEEAALPDGYQLVQNYPNPFNTETTISFT